MAPPRLDPDGGSGPSVTMPGSATTEVDPGDIEDFAQYLKTLQQYWADPHGPGRIVVPVVGTGEARPRCLPRGGPGVGEV